MSIPGRTLTNEHRARLTAHDGDDRLVARVRVERTHDDERDQEERADQPGHAVQTVLDAVAYATCALAYSNPQ